ncbi:MAG: hypothetical protein PsegKO_11490 [Pseudohongiellaceae bacterium]
MTSAKPAMTLKQHSARAVTAGLLSVALALGAGLWSTTGLAQSPGGNSDALSLLLEQNQQLRSELQALRAMIEEQGFEIRKLQRDSLNRYTNMDDRLTALESAAVAAPGARAPASGNPGQAAGQPGIASSAGQANRSQSPASSAAAGGGGNNTNSGAAGNSASSSNSSRSVGGTRGTLQPAVLSEQQLYQMAYDSVINSNFERSIAEFDQYLSIYPEGRFVTNAHYWKGQAFLYLNRYDEAREAYQIILEQYPDSAKLPDAMYGLGLAYQGLGNIPRARQLLNDIKRRFPNTGVANLADTRLLTLD